MMDENYEDEEEMQSISEEAIPEFKYEEKQELDINKLVHSILYESSKNKSVMSETMIKKLCESVGV